MLIEGINILEGERDWVNKIKKNLLNANLLKAYSEWLEKNDPKRGGFIARFEECLRSNLKNQLPHDEGLSSEWLEVIGYDLLKQLVKNNGVGQMDKLLSLIRPTLRLRTEDVLEIAIGSSKIGGLPDMPGNVSWPIGRDCTAIFDESTSDIKKFSGFLCQINLKEIADFKTQNNLPLNGILSFFCYQEIEEDCPDLIGVKCFYFEDTDHLRRQKPPQKLSEGNEIIKAQKIIFEESYDLPEVYDGPWSDEIASELKGLEDLFDYYRDLNFDNMMGYGRSTSGGDPTKSKNDQHLILLENSSGSRLHIQIPIHDLENKRFDEIKLRWVDFD